MSSSDLLGESDKGGLDFYFGRPTEMMRKLETSKPVRRTKVEKKTGTTEGNVPESAETQGGYLFKWQRDADDDADDDDDDSVVDNATKSKARWQLVTGNMPPSALSIGVYFETDGPKGKPLRDGLVNAGGVCMIQPGTSMVGEGKLNLGQLSLLNETAKGSFFNDDDNVLALRSREEAGLGDLEKMPEEQMVFRRPNMWPPEAPGFPPPPPDGNENVTYKRVAIPEQRGQTGATGVRRMSRLKPNELKGAPFQASFRMHGAAMNNTPENSAAEAGAPSKEALLMAGSSFRVRESDSNGGGGPSGLSRTRAPSQLGGPGRDLPSIKEDPKKKGGMFKKLGFGPGSKKDLNSAFPGVYASYVVVPYMLPPPPQPSRFPAPGSNEERRLQKLNQKKMFLEDQYSQILELADEKIHLNEVCRELEAQITDSDAQINSLIGANDQ